MTTMALYFNRPTRWHSGSSVGPRGVERQEVRSWILIWPSSQPSSHHLRLGTLFMEAFLKERHRDGNRMAVLGPTLPPISPQPLSGLLFWVGAPSQSMLGWGGGGEVSQEGCQAGLPGRPSCPHKSILYIWISIFELLFFFFSANHSQFLQGFLIAPFPQSFPHFGSYLSMSGLTVSPFISSWVSESSHSWKPFLQGTFSEHPLETMAPTLRTWAYSTVYPSSFSALSTYLWIHNERKGHNFLLLTYLLGSVKSCHLPSAWPSLFISLD